MSLFTEHPLAIVVVAALLVALLLLLVLRTARADFLYAALGVTVLAAALLLVERRIVTPREQVVQTIHAIAEALESNNQIAVLNHLSLQQPAIRREAEAALKHVMIDKVKIKPNLKVVLSAGEPPTKATATFNAVVIGGDRRQTLQNQRGAWFFTVELAREGPHWRVVDYSRDDPRQGL